MNKRQKGRYYRNKVKRWLQSQGYEVYVSECSSKYHQQDILSADLIAMDGKNIIFIQVKSNKSDISKAVRQFKRIKWAKCRCLKVWVICWQPYAKNPIIREVEV